MKKILLVSGCSYTTENYQSAHHPELDCSWPKWPQLLAKKLDMNCINVGQSGAGQEYIYTSIVKNINAKNIGLVLAGWSRAARRDYYYLDKSHWNNDIWDEKGDNHYFIGRTLMFQYSFQQLCKSLGLKYKQVQIIDSYETARWTDNPEVWPKARGKLLTRQEHYFEMQKNPLYNLIDDNFIGFPSKELGGFSMQDFMKKPEDYISREDGHPNEKGHQVIAEELYARLG
tara:strand:- start:1924 stop:2610 length:687 start_codon:yes stop_codon:yes gene_type:complete